MSATDPTAGECVCPTEWIATGGGCMCYPTPAEPDGGDLEALAQHIYEASDYFEEEGVDWDNQYGSPKREAITQARAILASDWLAAVRREAGDERAEQIAQEIEALPGPGGVGLSRWTHSKAKEGYLLAIEEAARAARIGGAS